MPSTQVKISAETKQGLIELEKIISDGNRLNTLITIGSIANVFSSGFSIGTLINFADFEWDMLGETAKACNTITRRLCYDHCAYMYLTTMDLFWDTMSKKFQ